VTEDFSIGRGDNCDYCIEAQRAGKKVPHFLTLSKIHFRVFRVSLIVVYVFLIDYDRAHSGYLTPK